MIFIAAGKVSKDIMNPHDSMCKGSGLQKQCMMLFAMLDIFVERGERQGREILGEIERCSRNLWRETKNP
jgi:hypothetical protein